MGIAGPEREYVYYKCSGTSSGVTKLQDKCRSATVHVSLEDVVWQDIKSFVESPGSVITAVEHEIRQRQASPISIEPQLETVQSALDKKQSERERLISLYRKGLIDELEVEKELKVLEQEVTILAHQREAIDKRLAQDDALAARGATALDLLEQLQDRVRDADPQTKRELVEALVDGMQVDTVEEGGKLIPRINITYCFEPSNFGFSTNVKVPLIRR
jgi:site-specific DNA recombinase